MVNEHFAKRLWISFGIIVASIVLAGAGAFFLAGVLSANATAIVGARVDLNTQNVAVANLASLQQQATQAVSYQAAITQLLPNQYGLVPFAQWFEEQGKQYNVTANAALQGAVTPSQGATPGSAVFSFTITGSLADISTFMNFISAKSSGFLVSFNSFNITTGGTGYSASGQGAVFLQ